MSPPDFDDFLLQTFEDQHFSRKEKELLNELLQDTNADEQKLALYRHQAFDIARKTLGEGESGKVIDWLEEVVKALQRGPNRPGVSASSYTEAHFSPGDDCPQRIIGLLSTARQRIDICVFTITDDRISRAIVEAHRRKVAVRIITDNEKLYDPGSDIQAFAEAGIPVKVDATPHHMHHKFALFDDGRVLTGSYNWTRGAALNNLENFIISTDKGLIGRFSQVFEQLWRELTPLS